MTISSDNRKDGPYLCNGATVAFPFSFNVFQAGDVRVVLTDASGAEYDLALGSEYSVSLNSNQDTNPGGTVTTTATYATGYLVTLTSQVENLQPVMLTNAGGFYPKVINDALDRLTIMVQQVAEQVSRSIKVSISSSASPDSLIAAIYTAISSAATSATNAAASAIAAATSATNAAASAVSAAASAASLNISSLMQKANNLSDVSSISAARSNLGLGSAALLSEGTAANNLLQLDLLGKIPAVDGSQITNILPTQSGKSGKVLGTDGNSASWRDALTSGTAVAATSGTLIDFTGIPSWVKRITIMFAGVSTNGTNQLLVQLGSSGGVENTGYLGGAYSQAPASALSASGFALWPTNSAESAAAVRNGEIIISLVGSNTWVANGVIAYSNAVGVAMTAGSKALSAALDRVRITTVGGTDTFDAGTINIIYE